MYGAGKAGDPERKKEIRLIADGLASRAREENPWSRNFILLGDFNIFSPKDVTLKSLTDAGFEVPENLQELPSNASRNKYYDQIAFLEGTAGPQPTGKAGVVDFFQSVFREQDEVAYIDAMGKPYNTMSKGKCTGNRLTKAGKRIYYRSHWRTHQMSDHLPMWVEL